MMKTFVNRYLLTDSDCQEFVRGVLAKPVMTWGPIFGLFGLLGFFFMKSPLNYVVGTAGLIALVAGIITPILTVRELYKARDLDPSETTITFGEKIILDSQASHNEVDYDQVVDVVETDNLYCLCLNTKGAVPVKKGHFIQGEEKDFLDFIEKKRSKED